MGRLDMPPSCARVPRCWPHGFGRQCTGPLCNNPVLLGSPNLFRPFRSGWTMNAWSRFARQKEERTSSALTRRFELRTTTPTASYCGNPSAPCLKALKIIPSHAQAAARPPTHNSGGRAARLYSLCSVDFSPTLLLPRRPIRRSYALHRPASFCTAVRCYKLAATQLYCGAYNKAVGCPEARCQLEATNSLADSSDSADRRRRSGRSRTWNCRWALSAALGTSDQPSPPPIRALRQICTFLDVVSTSTPAPRGSGAPS